jgi:hypothetical protein
MLSQASTRSSPNGPKENTHSSKEKDAGTTRRFFAYSTYVNERIIGRSDGRNVWRKIKKEQEDKRVV